MQTVQIVTHGTAVDEAPEKKGLINTAPTPFRYPAAKFPA